MTNRAVIRRDKLTIAHLARLFRDCNRINYLDAPDALLGFPLRRGNPRLNAHRDELPRSIIGGAACRLQINKVILARFGRDNRARRVDSILS